MNALWLTRMCAYRHSAHRVASARKLVGVKIERQGVLLRKYGMASAVSRGPDVQTLPAVLLEEARAARYFWRSLARLMPPWVSFRSRNRRAEDAANKLLNIGYHYITALVKNMLEQHGVSAALGLLHSARTAESAPLAFDLVEMFRSDLVDTEVLRFLRLRRKARTALTGKDISIFLHNVKKRCERKYYLKDFRACHTYRYYMELQILKCIKAVNHQKPFAPLHLPTRHDTRCQPLTSTGALQYTLKSSSLEMG